MTTIDEVSVLPTRAPTREDDAAIGRCAACTHPLEAHDVIAVRFCAATTARALPRGCACRP
jgi:hypothetical protein